MAVAETVLNQQEAKLDSSSDAKQQSARLKKIIGIILSVVLVGVTLYVLNLQHQNAKLFEQSSDLALNAGVHQASNYRSYVTQYKDTKQQLEETTKKLEEVNKQLDAVTAELNTTKSMLTETQTMLAQAQSDNTNLKDEIQGIDVVQKQEDVANVNELQVKIKNLRQENVQVSAQLIQLKEQLRAFEADFSNMEEGRSLIALFQNKIKLVKTRMNYLKQEAYFTKVAAQKEKDRIESLNGNNGFVVKGGQIQKPTNNKAFNIDVKMVQ